jgi:hypothetical protein
MEQIETFERGLAKQIMLEAWFVKPISEISEEERKTVPAIWDFDNINIHMAHQSKLNDKYTVLGNLNTTLGYLCIPLFIPIPTIKLISEVKFKDDSILEFTVAFTFNGNTLSLKVYMDHRDTYRDYFLLQHKN